MSEFIAAFRASRWSSTKFWLTVGGFAVFTWLLNRGTLSQDNYLLLAGGALGSYLGVNLVQHQSYLKATNGNGIIQSKPPQQEQP